ncbi:MAG: peptide-methionine (S)-S-oxide reductase MsrA [Magnetococcus sp. DMHC-6]
MESLFDGVPGVISTTSGYIGGNLDNPTYEQVSAGGTGHVETVQVLFDPTIISYSKLLQLFWVNIDPTTPNRQFCDIGSQYRSAIFYRTPQQQKLAEASKLILEKTKPFPENIVTEISPATIFFPAEQYHQDYHLKNPIRYQFYRQGCGRDRRLNVLWENYDTSQLINGLHP